MMNHQGRINAICSRMAAAGFDLIVAIHDGAHFIETPNPVMVLSRFKSVGAAAVVLDRNGEATLIVTPPWDMERARKISFDLKLRGADDVAEGILDVLDKRGARNAKIGIAGLSALPFRIADELLRALPNRSSADTIVFSPAATKTADEIGYAREATRIAELAYKHLLEYARPGMSEDQLAVEIKCYTRELGAEDNFLLLCAGAHNRAVAPSNGRRLQGGDIILAELTPSYRGQLAQICRTIVLGAASDQLARKYQLVVHAMNEGIRAAVPGVPMSEICRAINEALAAAGYGEYCRPPHIRRRGHGLGFACNEPGDVSLDNQSILKPGMLFMIHPNQYLPETGYLLCGEPVLMTEDGAEPLTTRTAALGEIKL
jgi:Xaa-Pro aminopeptidase